MPRRALLIAHHFPPASGSGANRALAFARYLPNAGWDPLVLTPGAEWASPRDEMLLRQIPSHVRVIRTRSFEPIPSAPRENGSAPRPPRKSNALRNHLGHLKRFPDAHIGWFPYALGAAMKLPYEVAYSTSGPFTSHVIGLVLKRAKGRPWVAELRDGWYRWNRAIFPDYPAWRDRLERHLESVALRSADRVVLVTERMADAFRCQYPDLPRDHFRTVSNGFDPAQFESLPAVEPDPAKFVVVHSGALYYGRSLTDFLMAAQRLCSANAAFAERFRLRLLGSLDAGARAEIEQSAIREHVEIVGQVSHAESLAAMRRANVLLLVANTTPGAEATVPGKLFEYLAVGRPVLAIAPTESSTADVLRVSGGGTLAPSGDVSAIACALQRVYSTPPSNADVARYSRRELTNQLAAIFDELA